jgi:hypothetical protein
MRTQQANGFPAARGERMGDRKHAVTCGSSGDVLQQW